MQWGWRRRYPAPTRFISRRVPAEEYLDQPDLSEEERARSHRDLERIDRLPWQFAPLWRACRKLLTGDSAYCLRRSGAGSPWRLLELGSGSGHTARRVTAKARQAGIDLSVLASDRDPMNERIARLDWIRDPLPACDLAYSNLVLHHLPPNEVVPALRKMNDAARLGGVIYELNRSFFAFHFLRLTFPWFALSPVTVADALISVQQSFTPGELRQAALEAGIDQPRITTHGFFRNRLTWEKAPTCS